MRGRAMPNILQQKRRVRSAARERMQNLRWRSTAKTLHRRFEDAVADGDKDRVAAAHGELVSWLDRAAARGAIHPSKTARKKSQAARSSPGRRAERSGRAETCLPRAKQSGPAPSDPAVSFATQCAAGRGVPAGHVRGLTPDVAGRDVAARRWPSGNGRMPGSARCLPGRWTRAAGSRRACGPSDGLRTRHGGRRRQRFRLSACR